jgi:hypothetical protein
MGAFPIFCNASFSVGWVKRSRPIKINKNVIDGSASLDPSYIDEYAFYKKSGMLPFDFHWMGISTLLKLPRQDLKL